MIGLSWGILLLVGTRLLGRWPDNQVHVVFCNVGQGDSILIISRFTQVLIDSGPDQSVTDCLARHFPPGDTNIEIVIATHPDKDHIGGFPAVFRHFSVSHLYLIGVGRPTRDFSAFRLSVLELLSRGTQLHLGQAGQRIGVNGQFQMTVISPQEEVGTLELFSEQKTETELSAYFHQQEAQYKSINDLSIGTLLQIGAFKILLMGDIEKNTELALLQGTVLTRVHILKAGHHGSNSSTIAPFLAKVQPEFVVISAGKQNQYGHPHQEVMDRIAIYNSHIFRTDSDGDIEFITNGQTFHWKTQQ